jgi:hypothetical protein
MNEAELRYLFKEFLKEVEEEHLYDAWRTLAWYTGYWYDGIDITPINREDGRFSFWKDKPYIEMTEEEFADLVGVDYEELKEYREEQARLSRIKQLGKLMEEGKVKIPSEEEFKKMMEEIS